MNKSESTQGARAGPALLVVVVLLSLIVPGAGHFLRGAFWRGIAWAVSLAGLGWAALFLLPPTLVALAVLLAGAGLGRMACAADAVRVSALRPRWSQVTLMLGAFLAAVTVFGLVVDGPLRAYYTANYGRTFTIPSHGMEPTLLVGDYIVVDRFAYRSRAPERGDIVIFKYPLDERRDFIKRVIATAGDEIHIRGRQVFVNGAPLNEPYVTPPTGGVSAAGGSCGYRYGCKPVIVPPNAYFVMGDNRENSRDSRDWGFVQQEKIVARPTVVYFSWDGEGHRLRFDRIGRRL